MCIFKREQNDTGCGHPECKNYYLFNKQLCIQEPINSQVPNNILNLSNILHQAQNPSTSIVATRLPPNLNKQQSLNTKRLGQDSDNNSDEIESKYLNKKKIKLEDERTDLDGQYTYQNSISTIGTDQQSLNQLPNYRTLFNFNNVMMASNQFNLMANGAQGLNVPMGSENINSREAELLELKTKMFGLLSSQNDMLVDLKGRNEDIQSTLSSLLNEISFLKTAVSQKNTPLKPATDDNSVTKHPIMGYSSEMASEETLINFLYGPKPNFKYQLVLKAEISLPLYRERNFSFTVQLVDQYGNTVKNSNKIALSIGIYSSENPPKFIDVNTAGNKILKGFIEKDLANGIVTFDKIQVKEVTSHFRNGWIFLVVYPKVNQYVNNNVLKTEKGVNVDAQAIKPLIVDKVVVKAKKVKEKDQNIGLDETPNF